MKLNRIFKLSLAIAVLSITLSQAIMAGPVSVSRVSVRTSNAQQYLGFDPFNPQGSVSQPIVVGTDNTVVGGASPENTDLLLTAINIPSYTRPQIRIPFRPVLRSTFKPTL